MTTMAMEIARERQLDWLLGEVLGGEARVARGARVSRPWLAAALVVLGAGVAFGVAALRDRDGGSGGGTGGNGVVAPIDAPQVPEAPIQWHECHGEARLGDVPADVTALRCFDFTDAGLAALGRLTELTHLDLSGMDVGARGSATALQITDAGVEKLAALTSLRWLSLGSCNEVQGKTLGALRAIPRLEHLDLDFTGVVSDGIAQLPQLPSLRELVLSYCDDFHGRSLADVAKIPGLRRLELSGCITVKADDVKQLAALHELRHLDLSNCMGAFRGQKMDVAGLEDITNAPPQDLPTHDSRGVTDAAIAALVGLPLETLRLDGCRSLTDGVAESLGKLQGLRSVGLSELPKTTIVVLAALPAQLRELTLDDNRHLDGLAPALARFSALEVLSLNGLDQLDDAGLFTATRNKPLRVLRLGGTGRMHDAIGPEGADRPQLTPAGAVKALSRLGELRILEASYSDWFDAEVARALAKLPHLRSLDLTAARLGDDVFEPLAAAHPLRELRLVWAQGVTVPGLGKLHWIPLEDLDLHGCRDLHLKDMGLFESWPGVRVRLPNGTRYVEPPRPAPPQQPDGK